MMTTRTKVAIVALLPVLAAEMYFAARWWMGRQSSDPAGLRVSQQDEDAAPKPEPAVSVLVNGREDATVARGGPAWVTVAVTQRHAVNTAARLTMLRARAGRLAGRKQRSQSDEEALQRTQAAVSAMEGSLRLTLGEAGRAWTEAVQVTLRPVAGGEAAAWTLRKLSSQESGGGGKTAAPGVAVLDEESPAEVHLEPETGAWAGLAAGQYEVRACVGKSGGWQRTACSEPVRLTVAASMESLTQEQRNAMDGDAARVALLGKDWAELERRGKAMLGRDKLAGHVALGDAYFGQERWEQALAEYGAARSALTRKGGEGPRALNIRISRLLEKLGREE